jgi:hypothetical protein
MVPAVISLVRTTPASRETPAPIALPTLPSCLSIPDPVQGPTAPKAALGEPPFQLYYQNSYSFAGEVALSITTIAPSVPEAG